MQDIMRLLLGSQDLSPASLTEYSARALSPGSVYALTLDEASPRRHLPELPW